MTIVTRSICRLQLEKTIAQISRFFVAFWIWQQTKTKFPNHDKQGHPRSL